MSTAPLAKFLPVFGGPDEQKFAAPNAAASIGQADFESAFQRIEPPNFREKVVVSFEQHEVDAAYERGVEDGRREAEADAELTRAELLALGERNLERARADWVENEGRVLADTIRTSLAEMHDSLEAGVAKILGPILQDAARKRVLTALQAALSKAAATERGPIAVTGPPDLIAALEKHLGDASPNVSFAIGEGAEVSVRFDKTVIETRLASWAEKLHVAVA